MSSGPPGGFRRSSTPRWTVEELNQAHFTKKRLDGCMVTRISGRIAATWVFEWTREFKSAGGARVWLFDAMDATGYVPEVIELAAESFKDAVGRGLRMVFVAASNGNVRMGFASMRTSLRTAGVGLQLFNSLAEAGAAANVEVLPPSTKR